MKIFKEHKNARLFVFEGEDHISFITDKVNASEHAHFYIQITIGLNQVFNVETESFKATVRGIVIASNVPHNLDGNSFWQYYMLINPESNLGLEIERRFLRDNNTYELDFHQIENIINLLANIECSISYKASIRQIMCLLEIPSKNYGTLDSRCEDVINIIKGTPLNQLTIPSLAHQVYLSESRLSHLFKEEVGISFSSYLVHEKIRKSFRLIFEGNTLTDAALAAGFSSSSHFSRCVREKLGMSPSTITKDSRYMKV
ncbi:AraC family transcriptional regulator [Sporosarcina sp. NCCP-2716]|uniref:helix-turn-helix transcriptional regulator n=1 Tax=Sporosarcina sp. NCCP-2716 TaxID=2943679 RepID=UPI00203A8254|nr:helix-turn-helix transcriptional regulator [Sporosarcina sp. NCCP-2716]GKV68944.1 AraC family transcriptional regulator [Sporosarcina sp. NCCP-2716]